MAEARSPGLPRYRTFRLKPERAGPLEPRAKSFHSRSLSELDKTPESARLRRELETASTFARRALLPREAMAFFLALVFPLLFAPAWLFSWSCVQFLWIFSSLISFWA